MALRTFAALVLLAAAASCRAEDVSDLEARALAGDEAAQFELGSRLADGDGVKRDEVAATKWLSLAAEDGNSMALAELGRLLLRRFNFPDEQADANGESIDSLQTRGLASLERSAAAGNEFGQAWLAQELFRTPSLESQARAFTLWRQAAAKGLPSAVVPLARMHADGRGTPRNAAEAARLYRIAAEAGDEDAQVELARALMHGNGVAQDREQAREWFARAARAGQRVAKAAVAGISPPFAGCDLGAAPPADWIVTSSGYLSFLLPRATRGEPLEPGGMDSERFVLDGVELLQRRGDEPAQGGQLALHGDAEATLSTRSGKDGAGEITIAWPVLGEMRLHLVLTLRFADARARETACAIAASARPHPPVSGLELVRVDVEAETATLRESDGRERTIGMAGYATREAIRLESIAADRIEIVELFGSSSGGWVEKLVELPLQR